MSAANLAFASERREDRDEVHHRTRAIDGQRRELPVVVVNISPNGLMARCEQTVAVGETLAFLLPDLRPIVGLVRWSLGGRIGCEFAQPIAPIAYYAILPKLTR